MLKLDYKVNYVYIHMRYQNNCNCTVCYLEALEGRLWWVHNEVAQSEAETL